MQVKIFTIPFDDNEDSLLEMNRFLSGHKVLEIEQQFYQNSNVAYWSFCVRYLSGNLINVSNQSNKQKIDYKEILNEKEFLAFSKLRECRKIIAANDAVPAYAVFTDEELAGIARLPVLNAEKLIFVKGIGDKKTEKYGKQIIELFHLKTTQNEEGK